MLPSFFYGEVVSAECKTPLAIKCFATTLAVNYFNKNRVATNTESLIGAEAKVVERINNIDNEGVINLNGLDWTARSVDNQCIEVGTIVRIVKITGVKAIVEVDQEHENKNKEQL